MNCFEEIEAYILESPFRQMTNFNVTAIDIGKLDATIELLPILQREGGMAHGGFLAYFTDSLMGLSALTMVDYKQYNVFTAEMKVSYLRPGLGKTLRGEGRVIKKGNTVTFCEAEVFGENKKGEEYLVCKASATMSIKKKL